MSHCDGIDSAIGINDALSDIIKDGHFLYDVKWNHVAFFEIFSAYKILRSPQTFSTKLSPEIEYAL